MVENSFPSEQTTPPSLSKSSIKVSNFHSIPILPYHKEESLFTSLQTKNIKLFPSNKQKSEHTPLTEDHSPSERKASPLLSHSTHTGRVDGPLDRELYPIDNKEFERTGVSSGEEPVVVPTVCHDEHQDQVVVTVHQVSWPALTTS